MSKGVEVGTWKTVFGEEGDKKRWNQEGREGDNGVCGGEIYREIHEEARPKAGLKKITKGL